MTATHTSAPVKLPMTVESPELMPTRAHASDAGLDLVSSIDVDLQPGERALVPTGVAIALPPGTVGLVCPRSGLAAKHGVSIVNAPGIIDAGYRGPIKVVLVNTDRTATFRVHRGDRIAQLVITPVVSVTPEVVTQLDDTDRADSGFGSSGIRQSLNGEVA